MMLCGSSSYIAITRATSAETRYKIEGERLKVNEASARAQLASAQALIDQRRSNYNLRKHQVDQLRVRAGMKPIATVPHALRTIDTTTGDAAPAHHQRSDVCAVPAAGVVAEAMVALVVADAVLDKFGGDSIAETRRNLEAYRAAIPATLATAVATGD